MELKDINVRTFVKLKATIKEHEGSELELHVKLISILFDISEDEVLDLPLPKFEEYERQTGFMYKPIKHYDNIPNKIVLNGRKYNVVKDAKKLTASQFIDYNTYCQMEDPDSYLAQILSVFLIPEGEKYGSYDIEPVVQEISEYLSAKVAMDICFFFRKKSLKSLRSTLLYLGLMMKTMKREMKKNPMMKEKMMEILKKMREMAIVLEKSETDSIW